MEIGGQIKKHRGLTGLSQEALAEKVYVSRQTVSNWENGKCYPDIKSLLLLSELFGITLDELVKGDIEAMKKEIAKEDIARLNRDSVILTVLMAAMALSAYPLLKFCGAAGIAVWAVIAAIATGFAFKVEKFKKSMDISTYKEIVAFSEGRNLDEIEKAREEGKRPYQTALKILAGALSGLAAAGIAALIIKLILG